MVCCLCIWFNLDTVHWNIYDSPGPSYSWLSLISTFKFNVLNLTWFWYWSFISSDSWNIKDNFIFLCMFRKDIYPLEMGVNAPAREIYLWFPKYTSRYVMVGHSIMKHYYQEEHILGLKWLLASFHEFFILDTKIILGWAQPMRDDVTL